MKRKCLAATLCLALALGLTACGGGGSTDSGNEGGSSEPQETTGDSNTAVIAMGAGIETLDPGWVYEKNTQLLMNACYENLFTFVGDSTTAEPLLVDTYEFSEDGLTLTMTLKDGIVFASGNPMTSEDVVFSIMRCKNLKGNPSFLCDTIDSVEAPDEKTVVIHLNQADGAIIAKLTYGSMAIVDSAVVKEHGGTDAEDASTTDTARDYLDTTSAGSGMYVITSYTPDEEVILEKNQNYWAEPTNIDKWIVKIQPDANTQMMTLSQGDLDIALNLTDDTMAELEGAEGVEILNGASKTVGFVMMNMDEAIGGPVSNPKVQQAVRLALDYEAIQTICGEGAITPYSILQDGFLGAKGTRPTDYRDVEQAKALLAEAGYPDGFDIDLTVSDLDMEGTMLTDLAQSIKASLADVGINVNIVTQAWAGGYGDAYREGTLGFTVMYWGIDYNDPNVQLVFLPGKEVGLRANWTADMDPELAALADTAAAATDEADRVTLLEQVQDATYESGPFIMIAQAPVHIGYSSRMDGVQISDPYTMDLTQINIK